MKTTVNTKELKKALKNHKPVTSKQAYVLSGIRLIFDNNQLKLHSTNLDQTLISKLKVKNGTSGEEAKSVIVLLDKLSNLVNACDDTDINLEIMEEVKQETRREETKPSWYDDKNQKYHDAEYKEVTEDVTYKYLKADKMTFDTLNEEEFPDLPEMNEVESEIETEIEAADINLKSLVEVLDKVKEFPSKDKLKPNWQTFYIDCENNCIAATDSYKLATVDFVTDLNTSFYISMDSFKLLKKLNLSDNDKISVSTSSNQVKIETAENTLYIVKGTYKFPEYKKLIPESYKYIVTFNREVLTKDLKKIVKIFKDDILPVKFTINENSMKLEVNSKEIGKFESEIKINGSEEELIIGINPVFLNQCLQVQAADDVKVSMLINDVLKPIGFKQAGEEYILMPVRIEN